MYHNVDIATGANQLRLFDDPQQAFRRCLQRDLAALAVSGVTAVWPPSEPRAIQADGGPATTTAARRIFEACKPAAGCRAPSSERPARLVLTGLTWTFLQRSSADRHHDRSGRRSTVANLVHHGWYTSTNAHRGAPVLQDSWAPRCGSSSSPEGEEEVVMNDSSTSIPASERPSDRSSATSVKGLGASWLVHEHERASRRPGPPRQLGASMWLILIARGRGRSRHER